MSKNQLYFIMEIEKYIWVIPFLIDEEENIRRDMEENMKNKFELTEEEKQIENEMDQYKSVSEEKKKKIEKIIDQTKKNKAISLRINNYDLEKIKEKAEKEGVPYQTLITNILHKYISDQLYDKDQVFKTIKLLKKEKAI